jgi:hypothetical protein
MKKKKKKKREKKEKYLLSGCAETMHRDSFSHFTMLTSQFPNIFITRKVEAI